MPVRRRSRLPPAAANCYWPFAMSIGGPKASPPRRLSQATAPAHRLLGAEPTHEFPCSNSIGCLCRSSTKRAADVGSYWIHVTSIKVKPTPASRSDWTHCNFAPTSPQSALGPGHFCRPLPPPVAFPSRRCQGGRSPAASAARWGRSEPRARAAAIGRPRCVARRRKRPVSVPGGGSVAICRRRRV